MPAPVNSKDWSNLPTTSIGTNGAEACCKCPFDSKNSTYFRRNSRASILADVEILGLRVMANDCACRLFWDQHEFLGQFDADFFRPEQLE